MYAPTRTNAQTPTNTRSQLYITGGLPRGRGAGGGMLSSRDVFTLLVVEKNGKKRLVVWGVWVFVGKPFSARQRFGVCFPPRFTLLGVGSR
jgi:hypothetical protein